MRKGGRSGVVLDAPIAVAVLADIVDVGAGRGVITRQRTEPVLEAEEGCLDAVLLRDQIAHPCSSDELLSLEHATEQQADDDQHDGNFDQRKSLRELSHVRPSSCYTMFAMEQIVVARP